MPLLSMVPVPVQYIFSAEIYSKVNSANICGVLAEINGTVNRDLW
jgi:hypothetical protein